MSLGTDSASTALYAAARHAERRGTVLVAASGNEFHFHHNYPAILDEVITVGGLNPDTANTTALNGALALVGFDFGVRAAYSDYGPQLDVVAPTQVPAPEYGGGYTRNWSGTSAAAPHVAGVAALVQARGKALGIELRAGEVRQIVTGTADDLADRRRGFAPGWDRLSGYGRVNALRAVERVAAGSIPPDVNITAPLLFTPAAGRVAIRGLVRGRSPTRWTLETRRRRAADAMANARDRHGNAGAHPAAGERRRRAASPRTVIPCACARAIPAGTAARTASTSSRSGTPA